MPEYWTQEDAMRFLEQQTSKTAFAALISGTTSRAWVQWCRLLNAAYEQGCADKRNKEGVN